MRIRAVCRSEHLSLSSSFTLRILFIRFFHSMCVYVFLYFILFTIFYHLLNHTIHAPIHTNTLKPNQKKHIQTYFEFEHSIAHTMGWVCYFSLLTCLMSNILFLFLTVLCKSCNSFFSSSLYILHKRVIFLFTA